MPVATASFSKIAQRTPAPPPRKLYCGGEEPAFLLALAFSCGIILANHFLRSPIVWLIAFLVALAGAAFFYRPSRRNAQRHCQLSPARILVWR